MHASHFSLTRHPIIKKNKLLSSETSKVRGSEMKPLTQDRVYDNVLLGQGYLTPHGDEYGSMG
jgi:hypothetical protein